MTDPSIEERKYWIRKKWIEAIDFRQNLLNIRLSKPEISSEEEQKVREGLNELSKFKEEIEGGFTPKEPPVTAWKPKDGKLVPLTQEEQFEDDKHLEENWENLDICVDEYDFADYSGVHPDHEPRKTKAKKIIASIRDFISNKRKERLSEKTKTRITWGFYGSLALCAMVFGLLPTLKYIASLVTAVIAFRFLVWPFVLLILCICIAVWGIATGDPNYDNWLWGFFSKKKRK